MLCRELSRQGVRDTGPVIGLQPSNHVQPPVTKARKQMSRRTPVLWLDDAFRAPVTGELRHRVHELLRRGERRIVLNMACVSRIDAAGAGELVRAVQRDRCGERRAPDCACHCLGARVPHTSRPVPSVERSGSAVTLPSGQHASTSLIVETLPESVDVLVVGAGHTGLSMSGLLTQSGRDHLVVERRDRLGGGWQDRRDELTRRSSATWGTRDRYEGSRLFPASTFSVSSGSIRRLRRRSLVPGSTDPISSIRMAGVVA